MSIQINGLAKQFGSKIAVNHLTLTMQDGMYGLLGPNGAGKTTLMRMLATLLTPSGGTATLQGIPLTEKKQIRRSIGYLPQDFSFYPGFTVFEALNYLGMLSEMKDRKGREARIQEMLELVNLSAHRKDKVRQLSGGMRRRLGIAQMLLHDPSVLIVDEPTAGLDPEERIRFRNLLSSLAVGKTVLLSTHIVEDILQTCSNVAVLHEGGLLYKGSVDELKKRAQGRVWCGFVPTQELEAIRAHCIVVAMVPYPDRFEMRVISAEKPFGDARTVEPGLEDAYMLLLKGGKPNGEGTV